jgi:hypothetical protein
VLCGVGITTAKRFTVCILHPVQQTSLVHASLKKATGFLEVNEFIWSQTSGVLNKQATISHQNRVTHHT